MRTCAAVHVITAGHYRYCCCRNCHCICRCLWLPMFPHGPAWSPNDHPRSHMIPYMSLLAPNGPKGPPCSLTLPYDRLWSLMVSHTVHEPLGPPWSPTSSRNTQGTLEEHYGSAKRILGSAVGVPAEHNRSTKGVIHVWPGLAWLEWVEMR